MTRQKLRDLTQVMISPAALKLKFFKSISQNPNRRFFPITIPTGGDFIPLKFMMLNKEIDKEGNE